MKLRQQCIALLCALCCAAPASAVVLNSTTGSNLVTDYSSAALVSFDLDLANFSGTRLDFTVEDSDLAGAVLNFNAIVRNFSGVGISNFSFSLDGITFANPGSVTPTFGTLGAVNASASAAGIAFATPEYAEFHFGNPFALNGQSDWTLNLAGLQAGDRFSIRATVPEPASVGLMLAALVLLSLTARSKNRRK